MPRSPHIITCIKQVPGSTEVEIDDNGSLIRNAVTAKMNPFDLFAIETSLRLKEQNGATVTAITMGPPRAELILREAFMIGVDEGVLLTDRRFAGSDVLATAWTISQGILSLGPYDLVICGRQTTDGDTAQVGAEMAEFLGIPHVTNVRAILSSNDESITVEVDLPGAIQVARLHFPCLITVEKDIFQPRLPSFRRKLATRDKKVKVLGLDDLPDTDEKHYGLLGSPTKVQRVYPPRRDVTKEIVQGDPQTLAERLFHELEGRKFLL